MKVSIWVFDMPTSPSLPSARAKKSALRLHPTFTGMNRAGFSLQGKWVLGPQSRLGLGLSVQVAHTGDECRGTLVESSRGFSAR